MEFRNTSAAIIMVGTMSVIVWMVTRAVLSLHRDKCRWKHALDTLTGYDWKNLKKEFEEQYCDIGPDRLDRAYNVYRRLLNIAHSANTGLPVIHKLTRIAPFDKDVDAIWRLHASKSDYDAWSTVVFGGIMRPRDDTFDKPSWETREERTRTFNVYTRKHVTDYAMTTLEDFLPPSVSKSNEQS